GPAGPLLRLGRPAASERAHPRLGVSPRTRPGRNHPSLRRRLPRVPPVTPERCGPATMITGSGGPDIHTGVLHGGALRCRRTGHGSLVAPAQTVASRNAA